MPLVTPFRRTAPASDHQAAVDRQLHTLDRLAERGTRRLGSVYYRAACPRCGEPAVWRDEAVGQLPGLGVVRTSSDVVCCVTCDGVDASDAWRLSVTA